MLRVLAGAVLLALSLAAAPSHAQERPVVFVEVEKIFRESSLINEIRDTVRKEFEVQEESMRKLVEDIRERRSRLNKEDLTLSTDEKAEIRQEIERIEVLLNREDKALREDRSLRFGEFKKELEPLILELIGEMARENEYEMVLDSVVILYGAPIANITDDVIRQLDENVTVDQLKK